MATEGADLDDAGFLLLRFLITAGESRLAEGKGEDKQDADD